MIAHAIAIYGLSTLGPNLRSIAASIPVEVRFLDESIPHERWEPPNVKIVSADIRTPVPDAPLIDSPVMAPSDRAITIPARSAAPAQKAPSETGEPKLVASVEYLREPSPRYPAQSRRLREQGLVVLRVLIDERGEACSIQVETSSGHARLDRAAQEAVARAAFRPYMEDGLPRRAVVLIPIEFSLNRGSA